jgi:hypothetical protein
MFNFEGLSIKHVRSKKKLGLIFSKKLYYYLIPIYFEREIIQTLDGSTTIHYQNGMSVIILNTVQSRGRTCFFIKNSWRTESIEIAGVEAYPVSATEVLIPIVLD